MHASLRNRLAAGAALLVLACSVSQAARAADADGDPGVARLSVLHGAVDVKRADSGDTLAATVNAPLSAGDYVTTGDDAHAEIQFPFGAALRVASGTQLRFTRLEPEAHLAQLAAGTVELRLFRGLQAHPEVATPAATVRPVENGSYRITVENDGDSAITVRSGRADVITQAGTRTLTPGTTLAVSGTGDATQLQSGAETAYDAFDRWNGERDAYVERTRDFGYVDRGIVGADDLDRYGNWQDSSYGRAWRPDVAPGWSPYTDGRWTWQPYYGWTWVAAEPWGWAPYHYGRWFYASNGWCWSPGIVAAWPVVYSAPLLYGTFVPYQPALVTFFSFGTGFGGFGFGNIGWVPLAPFETFQPWWGSRLANRTTINNVTNVTNVTTVNNYYGPNPGGKLVRLLHNAGAPGGAVAVRSDNFAGGRFEHVMRLRPEELTKVEPVRGVLPVVPTTKNLAFTSRPAGVPASVLENSFAGFPQPKAAPHPFAEQQASVKALARKTYPQVAAPSEREAPAVHRAGAPLPVSGRHSSDGVSPGHVERIEGSSLVAPASESKAGSTQVGPAHASPAQTVPGRAIPGRATTSRGDSGREVSSGGVSGNGALTQIHPSRNVGSPWDRFDRPSGAAGGSPTVLQASGPGSGLHSAGTVIQLHEGTLDGAPGGKSRLPSTPPDPFSRFAEGGYGAAGGELSRHAGSRHSNTESGRATSGSVTSGGATFGSATSDSVTKGSAHAGRLGSGAPHSYSARPYAARPYATHVGAARPGAERSGGGHSALPSTRADRVREGSPYGAATSAGAGVRAEAPPVQGVRAASPPSSPLRTQGSGAMR